MDASLSEDPYNTDPALQVLGSLVVPYFPEPPCNQCPSGVLATFQRTPVCKQSFLYFLGLSWSFKLLMDKILHDLKDSKLWELWYIPYDG